MEFPTGVFTLSIDYESAWGYVDHDLDDERKKIIRSERDITIRLIDLFDKYALPATWAIVAHLLETDCRWGNGIVHSDWPRPVAINEKGDWFWQHPAAGATDDHLWFDNDALIAKIRNTKTKHEIASHSYAHLLYGDNEFSDAAVEYDLKSAKAIHEKNGLEFSSFVFPRNQVGHTELLKKYGLVCYRKNHLSVDRGQGNLWKRISHILGYYYPGAHTGLPSLDSSGLVSIPDSMLLLGRNGLRKLVLPGAMTRKIERGLEKAAERKEIFHLWFHPSNFSYDTDRQFEILETVLARAAKLRQAGRIEILTMGEIAAKFKSNNA